MKVRTFSSAAAFLLLATGAGATTLDYKIVEVYGGAGGSSANDVNNTGLVVGCYGSQPQIAFKWQDNHRTDLGPGCAMVVGDSGLIAGVDANSNPVLWKPSGEMISMGSLYIRSINAQDIAVGTGFMWQDGQVTTLPSNCGLDINDSNQVLCSDGIWKDGTITPFPVGSDGTQLMYPVGISEAGNVFGQYGQYMGLYRSSTGAIELMGTRDRMTGYVDFNDTPLYLSDTEGSYGAVSGPSGGYGLSTNGYHGVRPTAINAANWITGQATYGPYSGGAPVALLYIPVPPPSGPAPTPGSPIAGLPVIDATYRPVSQDFDHNGYSDPVWRDANGNYGVWLMDGANMQSAAMLNVPANWTLLFKGDFNNDYKADLVFQDPSGAYWITIMDGTSATSTKILDGGSGWQLIGVWNFDSDGYSDLLWYHPTQGFGFWQMFGTTAMSYGRIAFPDKCWPGAIGPFAGNGRDDIAWMCPDGHVELWDEVMGKNLGTIRAAGSGFVPAFVADFNFDYHADIVWRHPDGRTSLWLMNGASVLDSRSILDAGSQWHVIGTPDLNHDRLADLLFVADDGSVGAWTMSGTTMTGYALLLGGGSGWRVVNEKTTTYDQPHLWWRYADGSYGLWLMNGLQYTTTKVMLNGGTGWEMVQK